MKLELVMLATVFSMITERHVDAQLECYENPNFTGKKVDFGSNPDITGQFPGGPRACKARDNATWILYSDPNYLGKVNTFHHGDKVYLTPPNNTIGSILMLGNSSHTEGIFLFQKKNFQGGLFQDFYGEIEKVPGNFIFESVVVIGNTLDWTVARECKKTDCERTCLLCLRRATSGVSFIRIIDSTGMWGIKTVLPGACLGTKYTGQSYISECTHCSVHGTSRCDKLGNCICKRNVKGKICDKCSYGSYKDGNVCKICGCNRDGVINYDTTCSSNGTCTCNKVYRGKKCNRCAKGLVKRGRYCQGPKIKCIACNYNWYFRKYSPAGCNSASYSGVWTCTGLCSLTRYASGITTRGCTREINPGDKIGCTKKFDFGTYYYDCYCATEKCNKELDLSDKNNPKFKT